MFALLAVVDLIDTGIKGVDHFRALGMEYPIQQGVFICLCLIAIYVPSKLYQGLFVSTVLLYKSLWIYRLYGVLA